ncbi:hypothetical protein BDZ91DRAFT_639706, partial [Kalaharituber pfeilii]
SGVSFVSLIAPTEELFKTTIAFYKGLGFEEAFIYDRTLPHAKREVDHCRSSERESWLQNQVSQPTDSVTIKIRHVHRRFGSGAVKDNASPNYKEDWRGATPSVALYTSNVDEVISRLRAKKVEYQLYPEKENPVEV